MNDIDIKREKFMRNLNYAVTALVALVAFFVVIFAGGMTILAGSILIGALAIVNAVPVASRKLAIWKIKALKETAAENPIETMELESQAQAKEIEDSQAAYTAREAQGKAFMEEMAELAKDDPEGAAMYDEQIRDYHTEMQQREEQLRDAVMAHEEFKKTLEQTRRRWRAAMASEAFNAGKPDQKAKILRNILVDEAMNAVRVKANESAARLKSNAIVNSARKDFKTNRVTSTQVVAEAIGFSDNKNITFDAAIKQMQPNSNNR